MCFFNTDMIKEEKLLSFKKEKSYRQKANSCSMFYIQTTILSPKFTGKGKKQLSKVKIEVKFIKSELISAQTSAISIGSWAGSTLSLI